MPLSHTNRGALNGGAGMHRHRRGEGSRATASPMLCEICGWLIMCVYVTRCVSRGRWANGGGGYLKVTGYYHLNIFLIMTITCSRSELSDTGRQVGVVDSYLETQCTEQFAAQSQTNWIWATLDGGPRLLGVWILRSKCVLGWLAGFDSLHMTEQHTMGQVVTLRRG